MNPQNDNYYKKKYLKYKEKYFKLKNNGKYELSFQEYYKDIPEFCNETNEEYKNCEPVRLNFIKWMEKDKQVFSLPSDENIVSKENPLTQQFILDLKSGLPFIFIEGFYNNLREYENQLPFGAFVSQNNFSKVFKDPGIIPVSNVIRTHVSKQGFYPAKGSGKINLHDFANKMKSLGFKYLFLSANGGCNK